MIDDATRSRAVLVVDDDRDLRELVADVLEGSGRRVFTARDGADALQQLDRDGFPRPCLLLLDWYMAPMGGRACVREAPAFECNTRVRLDSIERPTGHSATCKTGASLIARTGAGRARERRQTATSFPAFDCLPALQRTV